MVRDCLVEELLRALAVWQCASSIRMNTVQPVEGMPKIIKKAIIEQGIAFGVSLGDCFHHYCPTPTVNVLTLYIRSIYIDCNKLQVKVFIVGLIIKDVSLYRDGR